MTRDDYLAQRKKYADMADATSDPTIAGRLRTLARNCLLLASDPTSERLHGVYVGNCRALDEFVTKTGRYAPGAANAIDVQAKLAEIRAGGDAEEIASVMRSRVASRGGV
jgi:hypothetical protein